MKSYADVAAEIAEFLSNCQIGEGFPLRSFYGETYSILLWSFFRRKYRKNIARMIKSYEEKNKKSRYFHWEFNNYALQEYFFRTGDGQVSRYVKRLKFSTPFYEKDTNWILLRSLVRIKSRRLLTKVIGFLQAFLTILLQQKQNIFYDDYLTKHRNISYQYHSFALALVGEMYLVTGAKFFKKSFLRGLKYIIPKIKEDGKSMYMGRGQEQIFGYGALIFSLELAYRLTREDRYKKLANKVFRYLLRFQKKDGSFPLVLREEEKRFTLKDYKEKKSIPGWYPYNNFFDYLPFLGYYLLRAHELSNTYAESSTSLYSIFSSSP